MNKKHTILLCGGHITPAIALMDGLTTNHNITIVFAGRMHALEGSRFPSFEYKLVREKGIRFIPIYAGRLQRHLSMQTIPSLLKIPVGFVQALWYCVFTRPSLIVSFGGYVALPVTLAGWILGIPVITHEQTHTAGLANRIIGRLAKRVCVTHHSSLSHFPEGKAVYTGLPMREGLFIPPKTEPFAIDDKHFPVIYVTGGGTGAESLNRLLFPILPQLLKKYTIVHQVGDASLAQAEKIRNDRYIAGSYFSLETVSWILHHAAFVIGRSGANTVMELAALGKVAILIPLPHSAGNEQQENALWLVRGGGAVVVSQNGLTPESLEKSIEEVRNNLTTLQARALTFTKHIPRDGTKRVIHVINEFLPLTA